MYYSSIIDPQSSNGHNFTNFILKYYNLIFNIIIKKQQKNSNKQTKLCLHVKALKIKYINKVKQSSSQLWCILIFLVLFK